MSRKAEGREGKGKRHTPIKEGPIDNRRPGDFPLSSLLLQVLPDVNLGFEEADSGHLFVVSIAAILAGDEPLNTRFNGCVDQFDLACDTTKAYSRYDSVLAFEGSN